jgi:hypothetical protein
MDCHYSCGSGTRDKGPQELPDREFELKTQQSRPPVFSPFSEQKDPEANRCVWDYGDGVAAIYMLDDSMNKDSGYNSIQRR